MPGLIDLASGTTEKDILKPDKMLQADAAGYEPVMGTVNQDTDSVSGQLDRILGKDSPYLDRARAGATQYANSRGLINSSIAAGAGEAAAIDAALPIASQDASTYSQQRLTNQAAGNTALGFGADSANRAGIVNAGAANEFSKIGATAGAASKLQAEKAQQDIALQTLRGNQATGLADIEANYKTLLQVSDAAKTIFATQTQMMTAVMGDINTTPEQKQAAVDRLTGILRSSLAVIGGAANVDLNALLDFA